MSAAFLPADVRLDTSYPPLLATFGKTEAEYAAALIVRALQAAGGTEWRAVTFAEIVAAAKADLAAEREPIASLARTPFISPDVDRLVRDGFATLSEDRLIVEFTEAGRARLAKHVLPSAPLPTPGAAP